MHNTEQNKNKSTRLSKQAVGTINKVINMIETDVYCIDIIQQIDSAIGLLKSTKREMLKGHLDHCLQDNLSKDKNKTIAELIKVFKLES